jgi:hypothetical protein
MFKKIIVGALLICFVGGLFGCDTSEDPDRVQQEQTRQLMSEINRQIGMPNIKNFQQKKIMKMIYEECDRENLICYAYIVAKYSGKLIFIGKCVGYGVPFSAQYTNPERYYMNGATLPQADPNGLFMPTSSSATWLLLIDPKTNKPRPVYIEPEIIVSPFPLK